MFSATAKFVADLMIVDMDRCCGMRQATTARLLRFLEQDRYVVGDLYSAGGLPSPANLSLALRLQPR
jgi:hypothetical protein